MSEKPFNQLTPAEAERLAILAEECAEVIQVVGKILRHGYESTHPASPEGPTNRELLQMELGHIGSALALMLSKCDLSNLLIFEAEVTKTKTIREYLHHQ
jgi:hypothetical protein